MKSQSSPVPPSSAAGAVSAAASPASADGLSARSEATFVSAFAARSSRAAETTGASAAVSFFVSAFVSAVAPPAFPCRPRHCRNVQCHDEALFMFACELWRSRFFENGTKFPSQTISIHCRPIFNNFKHNPIITKMIKQVQFQAPFSEKRLPVQKIYGFLAFSCHNVRNRCNSRHNSCENSSCIELLPHTTKKIAKPAFYRLRDSF